MADPGIVPDLGAVGASARVSKKAVSQPQDLVTFSVKKGDNGGVIVSETYEKKTPAGRRASSFMGGGDYKENPFSPEDGAAAASYVTGLLSQMGVSVPEAPPMDAGPSLTAAQGPLGGAALRVSGGEGY